MIWRCCREKYRSRYRVGTYDEEYRQWHKGLVPHSNSRRRRNRYGRSGFDRDLIIRLLTRVVTDIINATIGSTTNPPPSLCHHYILHSPVPRSLSCLSSQLVNSRRDITGQIRQTDYPFLFPSPRVPLVPFHSLSSFHSPPSTFLCSCGS